MNFEQRILVAQILIPLVETEIAEREIEAPQMSPRAKRVAEREVEALQAFQASLIRTIQEQ
ncbi:MAG: hypothetical protein JXR40_03815 [Pontiellaceae bacterium]|nr:hypothetical protein [Pontiellaceae bacterium]